MSNPYKELEKTLNAIATTTSVIRTRADDLRRLEVNGGTVEELATRVDDANLLLTRVREDLEKQIV